MSGSGWKAAGAVANIIMVVALVICIAERAAITGLVIVIPLIAFAAYAEYRADKARRMLVRNEKR